MTALVETIEREVGPIEVAVFNIGANVRFPIRETTARVYFKVWEMGCFRRLPDGARGGEGHGAARPRHYPVHGRDRQRARRRGFSAFSGAKHGLRALAQSMARELGPLGIHVAHPIIDGAIDTEFIRTMFPERYALKDRDGILNPDAIAEAYWQLHLQPRSAWTHEMDLRPWIETW